MELLDQEQRDFLCSGVAIALAACGEDRDSSIVRALACKLIDEGRRIAVFLRHSHAQDLLRFIEETGRVTAVFCLPSTCRTMQIKGHRVLLEAFDIADSVLIERHLEAFLQQVLPLGEPEPVVRTIFAYDPSDLLVLSYEPAMVFSQTPGPKAGELLGSAT